jgi:hypothetical protein
MRGLPRSTARAGRRPLIDVGRCGPRSQRPTRRQKAGRVLAGQPAELPVSDGGDLADAQRLAPLPWPRPEAASISPARHRGAPTAAGNTETRAVHPSRARPPIRLSCGTTAHSTAMTVAASAVGGHGDPHSRWSRRRSSGGVRRQVFVELADRHHFLLRTGYPLGRTPTCFATSRGVARSSGHPMASDGHWTDRACRCGRRRPGRFQVRDRTRQELSSRLPCPPAGRSPPLR